MNQLHARAMQKSRQLGCSRHSQCSKPTIAAWRLARTRQCLVVSCQAGDPNKPLQSNSNGTLSSQSGNVMVLPRYEAARKYWRTVYDFKEWERHRNSYRKIYRFLTIAQSHILQNILPSVGWVAFVSVALTAYQALCARGALPPFLPDFSTNSSAAAFTSNTSVALSLLLVFRTNASYGRWDEARKMWGGLLNRSRDIMRQGATLFPDDAPEAKKALARWMVGFSRALRIHFQPEVTLESELSTVLTPKELAYLAAAPHRPVRAIHAMAQVIQNVNMSPVHQMQMSQNLTFFHDVLGGCERLLRAPIPVSYTRHTARFLIIWLTMLPFATYGQLGVWTAPTMTAVAAVLCGIKEIGVQCEEPFGILPLDVICNRIQLDVMATLKDDLSGSDLELRAVLAESMGLLREPKEEKAAEEKKQRSPSVDLAHEFDVYTQQRVYQEQHSK